MGLGCYLAMTSAEFHGVDLAPEKVAWMACQFSGHGVGLSNLPAQLPRDSVIILNDQIPISGHDPQVVKKQLWKLAEHFSVKGILLDLERPFQEEMAVLVQQLSKDPPCPLCVSTTYAKELACPVFLPSPDICTPLTQHLAPWKGREIWLELAVQAQKIRIDTDGSSTVEIQPEPLPEPVFYDTDCFCRYHWHLQQDAAVFTLSRQLPELCRLEEAAKALGVQETIGLYQQLG